MKSVGTRFNWYTNSADWKPFHHDSAAFNPQRARNQNITVGVSFGQTRELAFLNAKTGDKIYFPQTNGMLFSFGRDVNINWKHGVNALPEDEHDGKGRISIILWGLAPNVIEEAGSPPMLTDNTRGNGYTMHKSDSHRHHHNDNHHGRDRHDDRRNDRRRDDNRRRDDRRGDDRHNHSSSQRVDRSRSRERDTATNKDGGDRRHDDRRRDHR